MNTKVTRVKHVKSGTVAANDVNSDQSQLKICAAKWKHLQPEVASKKWSECPPEMTSDFVRAMVSDFKLLYGANALDKACQSLCCTVFADPQRTEALLSGMYLGSSASCTVRVQLVPETESAPVGSVDVDVETSEGDIKQALHEWSTDEHPATRIVFDPINLPQSDIVNLVKNAEDTLNASDLTLLTVVAAVILCWQNAERNNASTTEITFNGLSENSKLLRPGLSVCVVAATNLLDHSVAAQIDTPNTGTVSYRKKTI